MTSPVSLRDFDAVLFDLDGVLTTTRTVHAAAWKRMFDEFLAEWDTTHGTHLPAFDELSDYASAVDGKPREIGVRDFLASRGITLPPGTPDAPAEEQSEWGLGNRKQILVEDEIARNGVEAFPGSVAWVRELREAGLRTAVVSSSRNCAAALEAAGIANLFDARVDGETILELGLRGKPAPDGFLEGARRVGVTPERAVVVEDAVAGVAAGRAGGFGLVIGVNRDNHTEELRANGADMVVDDLGELLAAPDDAVHRSGPRRHRLMAAARRIVAASSDYPADPWQLVERSYNPGFVEQTETLFALSNGFLGIRGAFEEGTPSITPDTLLNGFHETWPIVYPETAFGFATTGQTILPVPDGTTIRLLVDEDPVTCETTEVDTFERVLDMHRGVLTRTVVFRLRDGRRFRVHTERLVSLARRHLACLRYEVTALDAPGRLLVSSELVTPATTAPADEVELDPRQSRALAHDGLRPDVEQVDGMRVVRTYRTQSSGLAVAAAMDHEVDAPALAHVRTSLDATRATVVVEVDAQVGVTVGLTKWLGYHYGAEDCAVLADRASLTLHQARAVGRDVVVAEHEREVADFWGRSEVVWEGASAAQQALHISQFALLQASWRSEGHGVPSKGLTGTGYEGHYFWDTEAYLLPFLIHTSPDVARSLLMHRVRMLPDARRRAAEVGCSGALFPWRTINGEEASAYYAAGTAQYHINADIAYALEQYVEVTGDTELLVEHGAELLVETARMWVDLGFFSDRPDGQFVIHKVTGPDEYSTVVDNNLFTNVMAAQNMQAAADAVARLRAEWPADLQRLVERVGLRDDEEGRWRRAAERIYVPYDEKAGVHLQDENFLELPLWDFAGTPEEKYPLLLHYHPLHIYRHQVIKQADVVLATVLLPDRFTAEERLRIFEYYDPLTTGDSSLSECIQAIAAVDVGKYRTAEEYLVDAAAVDIADTAGNLRDGVHVASAGGTWMALVQGFAGYRWRGTRFAPMLPTRGRRLRFPLRIRGSVLQVDIEPERVTYTVLSGGPVSASHHGEPFTVSSGAPVSFTGVFHTSDDNAPVDDEAATSRAPSPAV
ncbi:beta-phosphoglucomutase family hydrolase [Cellulomonas sp. Root137]|uniref:beta-phosphoglucomutase family hydrolase n=1 Tax=Cellulomonas sp. Root137 TaxID=1736459 RepID=UPI0006F52FDD|nr:beta-phosphoglucomutase family hydrolase [Cellulomonas sp. Root137]KQY46808.1 beta-phosphoglucomutase [Cellulomonas sp. Root137]